MYQPEHLPAVWFVKLSYSRYYRQRPRKRMRTPWAGREHSPEVCAHTPHASAAPPPQPGRSAAGGAALYLLSKWRVKPGRDVAPMDQLGRLGLKRELRLLVAQYDCHAGTAKGRACQGRAHAASHRRALGHTHARDRITMSYQTAPNAPSEANPEVGAWGRGAALCCTYPSSPWPQHRCR